MGYLHNRENEIENKICKIENQPAARVLNCSGCVWEHDITEDSECGHCQRAYSDCYKMVEDDLLEVNDDTDEKDEDEVNMVFLNLGYSFFGILLGVLFGAMCF